MSYFSWNAYTSLKKTFFQCTQYGISSKRVGEVLQGVWEETASSKGEKGEKPHI
jgi:hypothetical protein